MATQQAQRTIRPRRSILWIVVALLNLPAVGCGGIVQSDTGGGATTKPAATSAATVKDAAEQKINIDNFTYDPAEVTIKAGTKVTWLNRDDVPHTATSSTKPRAFDSKTLDTDQQFSFVFDKPGTYEYFCAVHPKMTGRVIVK
jgi:plastocyanin